MKLRLKALGLAMVAMLALGAASASAVHAKGMFGAETYSVTVKGAATGEISFRYGAGTKEIVCANQQLSGTLAQASPTLELAPEYANCVYKPGSLPVVISANGCTYDFAIDDLTSSTTGTGSQTIDCPAGKELTIFLYGSKAQQEAGITTCEWGLATQGPLVTVGYTAKGSGSTASVDLAASLAGIKASVLKGSAAMCGASAGGSTTFGASSAVNVTAESGGVPRGLSFTGGGVYMAGAASAEPSKQPRIESEWGAETISVAGGQDASSPHVFKVGNTVREVKCGAIQFAGELAGPSTELPLAATYSGCTAYPGKLAATVSMNSCEYELNVLNVGPPYAGSFDVACAGADGIDIKIANTNGSPLCHYKVASQSGLTSIGLETVGSDIHRGVGMDLGLSGISYTLQSGTAIACGAKVGVPTTNLSYSGGTTLFAS